MSASKIVVGYDFRQPTDIALSYAVEFACKDPEQILHFVVVLGSRESYQEAERIRRQLLDVLTEVFRMKDAPESVQFYVHARIGDAADEIVNVAEEIGADLIVLGCHERGTVERILLGSVSSKVLHQARCPVLVARKKSYKHVELEPVVEYEHERSHKPLPHRYSYSSDVAQVRPVEWPIS
jgi:nucleotide-binding universal stress UspA family protein